MSNKLKAWLLQHEIGNKNHLQTSDKTEYMRDEHGTIRRITPKVKKGKKKK